jgi:hypothetical protein
MVHNLPAAVLYPLTSPISSVRPCDFYLFWPIKGYFTHTMPFPCRSPAALIHICHAATLPFSDSAVSFVKVRVVAGNIRTASLLLVTTFVELRVVAGRSRTQAGSPHAVSGRPMIIHTYNAVPMPHCAVALRGRFQNEMAVAWQGNGMGTAWHVWIKHSRTV